MKREIIVSLQEQFAAKANQAALAVGDSTNTPIEQATFTGEANAYQECSQALIHILEIFQD